MSAKLKDVAALAGVSCSTVSGVLNNHPNTRVSPERLAAILSAAEKLDYHPNMMARGLRQQHRYTIGILMPMVSGAYWEMAAHVQRKLNERGYVAMFFFWNGVEEIPRVYDAVWQRGVDGVITWHYHESIARRKMPAVEFMRSRPECSSVMLDLKDFARRSLEYLQGLGHRRIAYLGRVEGQMRYQYHVETLRELGLEVRPEWVIDTGHPDAESGYQAMEKLLAASEQPSAIIAYNDSVALGIMAAARKHGLDVPRDYSLIGFDNMPDSRFLQPALTSGTANKELVVEALVSSILCQVAKPETPRSDTLIIPELIVRDSCCKIDIQS